MNNYRSGISLQSQRHEGREQERVGGEEWEAEEDVVFCLVKQLSRLKMKRWTRYSLLCTSIKHRRRSNVTEAADHKETVSAFLTVFIIHENQDIYSLWYNENRYAFCEDWSLLKSQNKAELVEVTFDSFMILFQSKISEQICSENLNLSLEVVIFGI
jgi:hypothetical protein